MKILNGLHCMKVTPIKLEEGTFLNVELNESQFVNYKVSNEDIDIVNEMVDLGGYASALLYLNENCSIYPDKFTDIFESEQSVLDYYSDCAELLNMNKKTVSEMGRPLCSIKGYNIYESEKGLLRGNGSVKILENFKLSENAEFAITTNLDSDYQFLSDDINNIGEANDWLKVNGQKMMQENPSINLISLFNNKNGSWDKVNQLERNPVNEGVDSAYDVEQVANDIFEYYKDVEHYDFLDNYGDDDESAYEEVFAELQTKDGVQKFIDIFKNEEVNEDISVEEWKTLFSCKAPQEILKELEDLLTVNECEGTQVGDIAPKNDYPQSKPVNSDKKKGKYYDLLLSQMDEEDENFTSKGFYKGTDGVYRRGNYVLIKEGESFKVINKKYFKGE